MASAHGEEAHDSASAVSRGCQHVRRVSEEKGRTAVSEPIFSKMSLMKEFMMDMALEEIPVSYARRKMVQSARERTHETYTGLGERAYRDIASC